MDISAILDVYAIFLKGYGAKDCHGNCHICSEYGDCAPAFPSDVMDVFRRRHQGLLTDKEIVAIHSSMGADQFIPSLQLMSKVEELGFLLPSILATDISSGIDFGCGPGFMPIFLAKNKVVPWRMAGLDGSESLVEFGQKMAKENGVEIDFYSSLADHTPLPDKAYDLVMSANLIDCNSNWKAIAREMARVAKKRLVIFYGLHAEFRYIDPLSVLSVLSESMVVDSPEYLYAGKEKDSVMITAHSPAHVPQTSSGIVFAKA